MQRQTACSNDEPADNYDKAAQSLGALGSESWTTSMIFHGFIIGYHHVPYLIGRGKKQKGRVKTTFEL